MQLSTLLLGIDRNPMPGNSRWQLPSQGSHTHSVTQNLSDLEFRYSNNYMYNSSGVKGKSFNIIFCTNL